MTLGFLDRLRPRREAALPVVIDGLSQVRAYWEGLRLGQALPTRRMIDPRGLTGALDRVFLADRIGRGQARVRIAGSSLNDFAGLDLRGLPLGCLFTAESRPALAETLERVFTAPALAEIDLGSDRSPGSNLAARLLLLPLQDDTAGRDTGGPMVLGVLGFAAPQPARCKLQIRARREERLVIAPVAEVAPPPVPTPIRRLGHLSLVHSAE